MKFPPRQEARRAAFSTIAAPAACEVSAGNARAEPVTSPLDVWRVSWRGASSSLHWDHSPTDFLSASQGDVWGWSGTEEVFYVATARHHSGSGVDRRIGVFHVASTAIHILIVLAIVSLVMHLFRGRRVV